jgi:ferredoxin
MDAATSSCGAPTGTESLSTPPTEERAASVVHTLIGILYSLLVLAIMRQFGTNLTPVFWRASYALLGVAVLVIYLPRRSIGLILDLAVCMWFTWWLFEGLKRGHVAVLYLPLVTIVMISTTWQTRSKVRLSLAWLVPLSWFALSSGLNLRGFGLPHAAIVAATVGMLVVFTMQYGFRPRRELKTIDLLLCSYSGNTAHFAEHFMRGARQGGAEVVTHRFHYYKGADPALGGDALAIAFPVFGGKPPWPFLNYLLLRLPRGKGKPAFVLYTCIGGAENAGFLCWLILTLKGYRVVGRNWTVYPLNVPTLRLGPKALWRILDSLVPSGAEIRRQVTCGARFARGEVAGIPLVFGPTPFSLVGILLDNKLIDTILYRNHVIKRRCTGCRVCVRYCPAQRLRIVEGYPVPKGECALCMGCVNTCPENAMHLWLFTEYGNQYKPKYPDMLARLLDGPSGPG